MVNFLWLAQFLVDTMQRLNWNVEEFAFDARTPVGHKTFTNVVATLDPTATRRLVIACHYDSKIDNRGEFIGATDSAVPCAMMLHLATALHSQLATHSLKVCASSTVYNIYLEIQERLESNNNKALLYSYCTLKMSVGKSEDSLDICILEEIQATVTVYITLLYWVS